MHIAFVLISATWIICAIRNKIVLGRVHGGLWQRKYFTTYGPTKAKRQSTSERRWFVAAGPITSVSHFLSRKGYDMDSMLPLGFKRKDFTPIS
jgi:hypothetical protein